MFQVSFLGLLVRLNISPGLFIDYIFPFLNCLFPSFAHTSAASSVCFSRQGIQYERFVIFAMHVLEVVRQAWMPNGPFRFNTS